MYTCRFEHKHIPAHTHTLHHWSGLKWYFLYVCAKERKGRREILGLELGLAMRQTTNVVLQLMACKPICLWIFHCCLIIGVCIHVHTCMCHGCIHTFSDKILTVCFYWITNIFRPFLSSSLTPSLTLQSVVVKCTWGRGSLAEPTLTFSKPLRTTMNLAVQGVYSVLYS